jgi:hypothetical protein
VYVPDAIKGVTLKAKFPPNPMPKSRKVVWSSEFKSGKASRKIRTRVTIASNKKVRLM